MLEPWDIFCWNQHSRIKDLTKYEPNLRTRNFWWGGPPVTTNLHRITMAITVLQREYHVLPRWAMAAFLEGVGGFA